MTISLYLSLFQINKSRGERERYDFGEEEGVSRVGLGRFRSGSVELKRKSTPTAATSTNRAGGRVFSQRFDETAPRYRCDTEAYFSSSRLVAAVCIDRCGWPLGHRKPLRKTAAPLTAAYCLKISQTAATSTNRAGVEYFHSGLMRPLRDTAVRLQAYFSSSRLVTVVCVDRCGWPL
ncbi:hypothetical protein F2Q70_00015651 [Brassica cretica]|uniref:Uncharacterized protein n=1 Tax=Brassica cretica TaxID=69181 RepID=A0A8S9I0X7_BRACR|nr:hypothetical protein F2Q70_00015651 [Brassica cretica]